MVADSDAIEFNALSLLRRGLTAFFVLFLFEIAFERVNEREICRAASDVADENAVARLDERGPVFFMSFEPRVERRLRFFDERDARELRELCRLEGERTGRFVRTREW